MERARTEWLRTLEFDQIDLRLHSDILLVVASANIKYLQPARFNDVLEVSVRMVRLGRVFFVLEQEIDAETGTPLCRAAVKIACIE